MLLPTKRLSEDRALIGIAGELLVLLEERMTISRLWEEYKEANNSRPSVSTVTFDWFVLSLDLLFSLGAITLERGMIKRLNK